MQSRRMDELLSFAGVIALWLALSVGLWRLHRAWKERASTRDIALAHQAAAKTDAAPAVFDAIRGAGIPVRRRGDIGLITAETHALLKRIQTHGAYFDGVTALRLQIRRLNKDADCPPLSEILHIRRDLWAAAEIVLMEDVSQLGEAVASPEQYEELRAEAAALLFAVVKARGGEEDLIGLRLSLARDAAAAYIKDVEERVRLAREQERLPTFGEVIAYPIAAARALPGQWRTARAHAVRFAQVVMALAASIRESRSVTKGVAELRRAREELPGRLATAFERTSEVTRQGAAGLRRHYEFLKNAHDLQARYEQILRKRPEVTERGRQFIARLELAARSERLRLTSASYMEWGKRHAVRGLAHVLAALPPIQARLDEARADIARAAEEDPFKLPMSLPPPEEPGKKPELRE